MGDCMSKCRGILILMLNLSQILLDNKESTIETNPVRGFY